MGFERIRVRREGREWVGCEYVGYEWVGCEWGLSVNGGMNGWGLIGLECEWVGCEWVTGGVRGSLASWSARGGSTGSTSKKRWRRAGAAYK